MTEKNKQENAYENMGDAQMVEKDTNYKPNWHKGVLETREETARIRTTEQLLAERGNVYGSFKGHAAISQKLKRDFLFHLEESNPGGFKQYWESPVVREGLDMIFHKLGRIANGNVFYSDNYDDIAGYAKLITNDLKEQKNF